MNTTRRQLLKALGISTSGLIVGCSLPFSAKATGAFENESGFAPDAFLHLSPEGQLKFIFPRIEMGQGAMHGLTTLVAEELNIDPHEIEVLHAPADAEHYANPLIFNMQLTGGSTSMIAHYDMLRQAGANMRQALIQAAATKTGVDASAVSLADGVVIAGIERFPWGQLAVEAAIKPVPTGIPKSSADYRFIGKQGKRIDGVAKSTGTASFGLDIDIEGLHRAVVVHCPVIGGEPESSNAKEILAMPGVTHVIPIFNGIAVVADQLWNARKAAKALKIEWDLPDDLSTANSTDLPAQMKAYADREQGMEVHSEGDTKQAIATSQRTLSQDYFAPYLAHATMEPMNCTIKLTEDSCDIWTGTQTPDVVQAMVVSKVGLDKSQVRVHNQMLGGGFGRRVPTDYVREAIEIGAAAGVPVQVVWSREDDMRNDYYRPASFMRFEAGLDNANTVAGITCKRVGPQIADYAMEDLAQAVTASWLPESGARWLGKTVGGFLNNNVQADDSSVEGLIDDYDVANRAVHQVSFDPGLRLGYWRSVGHSFSAFGKESFYDELAAEAGADPFEFRLKHLSGNPRLKGVIERVAELSDWTARRAAGEFIGIAAHTSFGTAVAEVAKVSVNGGKIKVEEVWCAVDCGYAVNPSMVQAQMESGIIFGLSAALDGEINYVGGVVQEGNFNDYPVVRMAESPQIHVAIVNSSDKPLGGVGEPGTPPIAPAVANAVFAATGMRLRSLPLHKAIKSSMV